MISCPVVNANAGDHEVTRLMTSFLRDKLASYKIPKKMKIIESIPKNHMGKVSHTRYQTTH
jgi:non-ribosomal peptide synthetase component E (peptide arylation enzyme)